MEQKNSGLGIASFVTSVLSGLMFFVVSAIGGMIDPSAPGGMIEESTEILLGLAVIFFLITSFIAFGLGIGGLFQKERKKVFAITGTVISLAIIVSTISIVMFGLYEDQIVDEDRLRVRIQEVHTAIYERDAEKWFSMLSPESKNNYSDLDEFKKERVAEDEPPWEGKRVAVIDDFCNCVSYKTSDMCTFLVHHTVIDEAGGVLMDMKLLDVWLYEDGEWYWFLTYWELVDQCPG